MQMDLVGQQLGSYGVTRLLGEGGMGAVYLGEHPLIGKKVAIKVLHDELARSEDIVTRFFHEAKAVNDIGHENIVDIIDFCRTRDASGRELVYLIMELLEGESLSSRLRRAGVTPAEAVHIADQCASALAASHGKGIVHRDLKPDNVFLLRRGSDELFAKLLDFGIAKLTGDRCLQGSKTRTGAVLGTPAYMSPEQCDGAGEIDHRTDIYSLGMVLYEMLAGRVAFMTEGLGRMLIAQIQEPPPPPTRFNPALPPELAAVVLRCLEKDPAARYQTMDELRAALGAFHQVPGTSPAPAHRPPAAEGLAAPPSAEAKAAASPAGASEAAAAGMAETLAADVSGTAQTLAAGVSGTAQTLAAGAVGMAETLAADGVGTAPTVAASASDPRRTTLSGAAAEAPAVTSTPSGRRVRWLPLTAVGALVLLGGAIYGLVAGPDARSTSAEGAAAETASAEVHVAITSRPSGARVVHEDGSALGQTPLTLTLGRGTANFDVDLFLDGYASTRRTVVANRDREIEVVFERAEGAAPPSAPR